MAAEYKNSIKQIVRWTATSVLTLLLLVGILFGLVHTEWGERQLEQWIIADLINEPDIRVQTVGMRGLVPFHVRLERIVVADNAGDWLSMEDVKFKWSPVALLKGRIHINKLHIAAVHFDRAPFSRKKKKNNWSDWPGWAARMASLVVDEFSLQNLSVGDSLLGERADFTVHGGIRTEEDAKVLRGFWYVERTDGPKALAHIDWALEGEDPLLTLDAVVQEEEGRLSKTLLGFRDAGVVSIELRGQGPVRAWKGRLHVKGDNIGTLESGIELNIQKDLRLKGEGRITLNSSILPIQVSPLLRHIESHFVLDVQLGRSRDLVFHRIDCENDRFNLRLEGRLDLPKEMIDVKFVSEVEDISFLNEVIDGSVKGRLVMEGRLSGLLRAPQSMLSLSLFEPGLDEFHASRLTSDLEFEVNGEWPSSYQGLFVRSKGDVIGFTHSDNRILLPESQFQWSAKAEVKRNAPITVNELAISNESLLLSFSGALDPTARSLKGNVLLDIRDLSPFSTLSKTEFTGSGRMQAQLEVDGHSRSLSAEIEGQAREFSPLSPLLAVLWGAGVEYRAHVELVNSKYLNISGLQAHSSSAEMSGDISTDFSTKRTTGRGFLSIPRLSVMNEPMGRAVFGSLALDMQIGGTWLDPTLNIQTTGHRVGTESVLLEQVVMSLQAEDLRTAPRGHLGLELQQPEYPIKVESEFLLENPRLLLSDLSIAVAGTESGGDLTIDLDELIAEGSLQGQSRDLSRFSILWGETIEGSVSYKAFLSSREKKQDLELNVQGSGLASRFGEAKEFALGLRLKDVFGAPKGTTEVKMKSYHKDELDFQTLTFLAKGDMRKVAFSGNAVGHYRKGFQFQTRGSMDLSKGDTGIRVDQFQGQFADYDFELISSAVIRRKAHEFVLEDAAFLLDKGCLVASGRLGVEEIALDARLEGLPVEVLNLIVPVELIGSTDGRLQISGRLDRPEALMEFRVVDMQLKGAAFQGLPPARLSMHITVEEDRLQADLSLEGLFDKPFRADMEVPAVISLQPLNFSLKAEDEIRGRISADLDLSLIPVFFYLEDQHLGGRLLVDLILGGGADTPEVKGKVTLSDGTYENPRSGTILRDVQIVAECEQNRIVLTDARGTDGGNGSISAQGWFQLFSSEGFPFQWDIMLNSATLIRRDDLTFLTSGDLRLSGIPQKTRLSGSLTLGPAEIRIPERFPPEVPDLEVIEINRNSHNETEISTREQPSNGWDLDLRLDAPSRVFVRGRGLDSEWKGELHLMGSTGDPSISGVLSVIRGRYSFLGKPFSLTNGTLTFSGLSPPSPILDFSAEYERSDMTAHIRLSGQLTSLDVLMDSEPPLPADEILSRLLFNRGVANISPVQALQLGQALNAMTGSRSPFDVADRTRRTLHVDQLDIRQSEEESGGASVSIGKYLTDNVYVEIEKGVGTEGGRILSEVELTPNVTFESETGTDSHVGVGLSWKWDY